MILIEAPPTPKRSKFNKQTFFYLTISLHTLNCYIIIFVMVRKGSLESQIKVFYIGFYINNYDCEIILFRRSSLNA